MNPDFQMNPESIKWSVDNVHNKYLPSVLHLLVALARHYGIPKRLPSFVTIKVIQINKASAANPEPSEETNVEQITGDEERETYNFAARQQERDVFDTLFDSAPDRVNNVKEKLLTFSSNMLSKMDRTCANIEEDFASGVNLVFMMSIAESYYVPLYSFTLEPEAYDHKVIRYDPGPKSNTTILPPGPKSNPTLPPQLHNVTLALNLMMEAGIERPKCTAESIVSRDLKSTLRVLFAIYTKYKHQM
eukprot:sb/3468894/